MKRRFHRSEMFCQKCDTALVKRNERLVCPSWFPFSGHYRGDKGTLDAVGCGGGIRIWVKTVKV